MYWKYYNRSQNQPAKSAGWFFVPAMKAPRAADRTAFWLSEGTRLAADMILKEKMNQMCKKTRITLDLTGFLCYNNWAFEKMNLAERHRCIIKYRSGCGAVGSALPWGGRGRWFKSSHSDQKTEIVRSPFFFAFRRFSRVCSLFALWLTGRDFCFFCTQIEAKSAWYIFWYICCRFYYHRWVEAARIFMQNHV